MPIREYRMTWILRLLTLVTLGPLAVFCFWGHLEESGGPFSAWLAVGIACLAGAGLVWARGFKGCVRLYEDRIEKQGLLGSRSVDFRDAVFRHRAVEQNFSVSFVPVARSRNLYASVEGPQGTLRLNSNVKDMDDLRERLMEAEMRIVHPQLASRHRSGEELSFGKLRLQNDELRFGRKSVSLSKILPPHLENGDLVIKEEGRWRTFAKLRTDKVGNLLSFLEIVTEARGD